MKAPTRKGRAGRDAPLSGRARSVALVRADGAVAGFTSTC